MKAEDQPRFRELLAGLLSSFNRDPAVATLDAYWAGLHDHPIEAVEQAVGFCLQTSQFMPSAAELRRFCAEIVKQAQQQHVPRLEIPAAERLKVAGLLAGWHKQHGTAIGPGSACDPGLPLQSLAVWREKQTDPTYTQPGDDPALKRQRFFAWRAKRNRSGSATPIAWNDWKKMVRARPPKIRRRVGRLK